MATIQAKCCSCNQIEFVRKYGRGNGGFPRFRCLSCKRTFQLEYYYQACKPGVKEKIIDMAMNSSGVRETDWVLNIAYNTVLNT